MLLEREEEVEEGVGLVREGQLSAEGGEMERLRWWWRGGVEVVLFAGEG